MTPFNLTLLGASTAAFLAAASAAKTWALHQEWYWLALTLGLYTVGNLIMLRLIRDFGMGIALSMSAVVQLIAVNVIALAIFGERLSPVQATGVVLAVVALGMLSLGTRA
jgi:small multidrug resistance pump